MAAELKKAELEAKLARCRALAKEFRSGSTAEMLRDMEEEICLEIRALAKR
jgi:hypothetical protein